MRLQLVLDGRELCLPASKKMSHPTFFVLEKDLLPDTCPWLQPSQPPTYGSSFWGTTRTAARSIMGIHLVEIHLRQRLHWNPLRFLTKNACWNISLSGYKSFTIMSHASPNCLMLATPVNAGSWLALIW